MLNNKKLLYFLSFMLMFSIGCEDEEAADNDTDTMTMETPTEFVFESRFEEHAGESSVSYSGQVVRNLLVNDIKSLIASNVGGGNTAIINSMMANDDPNLAIYTGSSLNTLQTKYHDISTSQLNDRLAAVTSYDDPGYGANAQDMITGWVAESEMYSVRPGGLDLGQMTQKVMWGAIAYWQGTSKYMSKIPNDDNTMSDDGDPYTAMEHHWDEGYGYFTDNNDYAQGTNRFWTKYANKSYMNGLGDEIAEAFRTGRAAITASRLAGGDGLTYHADVLAQRDIIVAKVYRMAAGMAIHYLYDVKNSVAGGESENNINHSFSEAYAFMYGLHTLNGGAWASSIAGMLQTIDENPQGFIASSQSLDGTIAAIADLAGITDPESFD